MKALPPNISLGATLRGNEYGWSLSSFPDALASAEAHGYGCLGGQFQFRLDDGSTCELYWLNSDPEERAQGESWLSYCHRSCSEVLNRFHDLVSATDFTKEVSNWPAVQIDLHKNLVFVAYFITEGEHAELAKNIGG